ncbi:hypothetical protein HGRIS_002100 [Hohenbuehelia grisea]|uniref:Uncharacterized protein n=1 Tax=Hohenbuehelia grisea TaxID=104357 RepID=A0ABR3JJF7_9AGAR
MDADVPIPGPSQRKLDGTKPGLLDPTQPARLLRVPNGTLAFASFDPRTATSSSDIPDVRKLSLNAELYRPKRVVLETLPNGQTFWRFVPKARWEEGVLDEGAWPRTIDICGQLVECSQDQWDIYKLDPMYECCVRVEPELTVISRVASYQAPEFRPLTPESASGKRALSNSPSPEPSPSKKPTFEDWESSDDEVDPSNSMAVDEEAARRSRLPSTGPTNRTKFRERKEASRQARRQKTMKRANELGEQRENYRFDFNAQTRREEARAKNASPDNVKRKVSTIFDSFKATNHPEIEETSVIEDRNAPMYESTMNSKRTRTLSPAAAQRDLHAKKAQRERRKKERRQLKEEMRKLARERQLMEELYAQVPSSEGPENVRQDHTNTDQPGDRHASPPEDDLEPGEQSFTTDEIDEEAERLAAIEESRRKLAELELDRPMWEEQARKREAQERAERERLRAKSEALRRQEEERIESERRARIEQAQREARLREEEQRREREEAARRERERQQRQQRWSTGRWTHARALERYKALGESFDTAKFLPGSPLTFEDVPWPVLHSPLFLSVQDIDWAAVEKFFAEAKLKMRTQDYKTLVQASHRRFHPDRWRARGLLKSIPNDGDRDLLEVAANTVAQALTPIWRALPK